jgi:hypothetical protein
VNYKRFSLANGVLQFMHAYPRVVGRSLDEINRFILVGDAAAGLPAELHAPPVSVLDNRLEVGGFFGGVWPMGLGSVPDAFLPGMKWIYDEKGSSGGRSPYGCHYDVHVPYALVNYPYDVEAVSPDENLPKVFPDPSAGHYVFREGYTQPEGIRVTLNLLSRSFHGMHYEWQGAPGMVNVWALGERWISSRWKTDSGVKNMHNAWIGGRVVGQEIDPAGFSLVEIDFSASQMQEAKWPHQREPDMLRKKGWTLKPMPGWQEPFIDAGIRETGRLVVDTTGRCGAPLLMVFQNSITVPEALREAEKKSRGPSIKLPPGVKPPPGIKLQPDKSSEPVESNWGLDFALELELDGNRFSVTRGGDMKLQGTVLLPAEPKLATTAPQGRLTWDKYSYRMVTKELKGLAVTGGDDFLVVVTVQEGPAPEVSMEKEGDVARVTVGGHTFDVPVTVQHTLQ